MDNNGCAEAARVGRENEQEMVCSWQQSSGECTEVASAPEMDTECFRSMSFGNAYSISWDGDDTHISDGGNDMSVCNFPYFLPFPLSFLGV